MTDPIKKFLKISDLCKLLNLIDLKKNKPLTHVIRYWESEFKQIKPKKINNQRYYNSEQVELVKLINFLLKDKKMTIKGVKNVLKSNINKLDDYNSDSLKASFLIKNIKEKSSKILKKINKLKKDGKKNTY